MPRLGLGLGAQISAYSAYDADAASYFSRAGVTDATAKRQISDFVKGLKNLGLWNSSVCWLLKSSQNAGTGLTAYSLGGLGTFDGTLSSPNGPTWGADGITFDGTNDRIALPNNSFGTGNSPMSAFCFFKPVSTAAKGTLWSTGNGNIGTDVMGPNINDGGNDVASMAYTSSIIAASDTTTRSILCGNTSLGFKGKNGGTVTSFTLGLTLNKGGGSCGIGCLTLPSQDFFAGVISAVIRIDQTPTTQLNSDIYNLYVSTLARNFDLDADAYISRASVTDPTAQTQINDFVVGVKGLGLWGSMVCWPLRSAQNSGTNTAYSLGGLGTYNGTLVNSPTWGTDGLTNSATGRITTSYFSPSGSQTQIFVGNSGAGGGDRAYANTLSLAGSTWSGFVLRDNGAYYGAGVSSFIQTVRDLTSAGNFKMAAALFNNPASSYTYLNTTQGAIGAGDAMLVSPTAMTIMSVGAGQYFVGTASFYGTFVAELTTSQYTSIYNLYKTTLGNGLGLP